MRTLHRLGLGQPTDRHESSGRGLASSQSRFVFRVRPDLVCVRQRQGNGYVYVVKDPVRLEYFQLEEQEYAILQWLDGKRDLREIKRRFADRFAPQRTTHKQLQFFLVQLQQRGLLLSDLPRQGTTLLQWRKRKSRQRMRDAILTPLAIRFRGLDPERLLRWLYPRARWFFSPWCVNFCGVLIVAAVSFVLVNYDALQSRLPDFRVFFSLNNVLWIALALALCKVLHELGHALACRHFGGECHEIGVMFLVFTPCLYCNVSDAWMLPNKWHRICVSAAGIYVDLIVGSVCTFLWWLSSPGWFNAFCFNTMIVCSVSSVVFNGNPLLKYDGYFILSDLLEIPNLHSKSVAVLLHPLRYWLSRVKPPRDRSLAIRFRGLLACYAGASGLYRIVLLTVICTFLYAALASHRLEIVAQLVVATCVLRFLAVPSWQVVRSLRLMDQQQNIDRRRAALSLVACILALGFICLVPLPSRITVPALIQPEGIRHVYVTVPGTLAEAIEPGERVEEGQRLAILVNRGIELEMKRLQSELSEQQRHLQTLNYARGQMPSLAAGIPTTQERIQDLQLQLRQRQKESDQLTVRAPIAGTVLRPPSLPTDGGNASRLGKWAGFPLDEANQGCFLERGTLLCEVGQLHRCEAILLVEQHHMELVQAGQYVRVRLRELPSAALHGTVTEIADIEPEYLKDSNADGFDDGVSDRPTEPATHFQVRVQLDSLNTPTMIHRARGRAKIHLAPQSLATRLFRWLRATFSVTW